MAMVEDNRPRDPEIYRQIEQLFDPEVLRSQDLYGNLENGHRSIDDHLDNTEDLENWALQKVAGTNIDPENRRPIQISDSPLSNYDVEFTQYDKTETGVPSLSSLVIPVTSNASLTLLNNSTQSQLAKSNRNSRLTTPRRSGILTPKDILLRQAQIKCAKLAQMRPPKDSLGEFMPTNCSTPVRSRRRNAMFSKSPWPDGFGHEEENQSDKTLTENQTATEQVSETHIPETQENANGPATQPNDPIIPETQPNDSIIPETQENDTLVPETQGSHVPETQDNHVPESQDVHIPETQDDEASATQDNVSTHPVQAQVTKQNTKQQAEPLENTSIRSTRIQARPPIRGQSQIPTPSTKSIPTPANSSSSVAKPVPRTPSRLPVAISHTPKTAKTIASGQMTEIEPNVGDVLTSNAHGAEAARTIVMVPNAQPTKPTQPSQPVQPSAVSSPTTIVPAPNMTIHVNVSNSMPQTPTQTPQIQSSINKNAENVAIATNGSDGSKRNSSNDSLMTNDEDSEGNGANTFNPLDTPTGNLKGDASNASVRRKLFSSSGQSEQPPGKILHRIDYLTKNVVNRDSTASTTFNVRSRSQNASLANSRKNDDSQVNAPMSQTFTKPRTSIQNATYDVQNSKNVSNTVQRSEEETDISEQNNTESVGDMADLPSEAVLEPIDVSEDDSDDDDVNNVGSHASNAVNTTKDVSNQDHEEPLYEIQFVKLAEKPNRTRTRQSKSTTQSQSKVNAEASQIQNMDLNSHDLNPRVVLSPMPRQDRNETNVSHIRQSGAYCIPPPDGFDKNDSIIVESSPVSSQANFNKPNESRLLEQSNTQKKPKRRTTQMPQDLIDLENHLQSLREQKKVSLSRTSKGRRLRSVDNLHDDDEVQRVEDIPSTSTADNGSFKVPTARAPRKSKRNTNASNSSGATEQGQGPSASLNGKTVALCIVPCDDLADVYASKRMNENENEVENGHVNDYLNDDLSDIEVTVQVEKTKKHNKSNAKQKQKPQPKQKSIPPKRSSKAKAKAKEPEVVHEETETDHHDDDTASVASSARRSSRARAINPDFFYRGRMMCHKEVPMVAEKRMQVALSSTMPEQKTSKRKSNEVTSRSKNGRNSESEPPQKKKRTRSEIVVKSTAAQGRARSSSASAKLVKGDKSAKAEKPAKADKSTRTTKSGKSHSADQEKEFDITSFTDALDMRMLDASWWNEINDMDNKDPIIHNIEEVDIEFINTSKGRIEVSFTHKINYKEVDGVDYGFVPSSNKEKRRFGFMRFRPKASKPMGRNGNAIELHILSGNFTLHCEDQDIEVSGATEISIPTGARYGLTNRSDCVGIVEFTYAS